MTPGPGPTLFWMAHSILAQSSRDGTVDKRTEFKQKQQAVLVNFTDGVSQACEQRGLTESKLLSAAPKTVLSAEDRNYVDTVNKSSWDAVELSLRVPSSGFSCALQGSAADHLLLMVPFLRE